MTSRNRVNISYGLIGLLLLGFMFWGARSLWDSSEARYGQVAFEMLTNGNWLVPTLAGKPHLTKPPFTYWMAAAGMKLFGVNAWGARFFLSVFFTGTLLCVMALARVMGYDRRVSLTAAFIFGTAIVPFIGGHTLTTDGFLTFWETLGILAAWKVWQSPARPSVYWRLIFWGAFGMGFFTKGPPALLPPAALVVFLWMRRGQGWGKALVSLPGIGLFIALSGWWFAVLIARQPDLLQYFWGDEVIGRIASTMHDRNDPFWIYAPVILFGVGPWMVLWPRLVVRLYARLRSRVLLAENRHLFLLLWFAIPLGVFVLAESRMPLYVMPLFVPLSVVMASVWCSDVYPRWRPSPLKWRAAAIGLTVWVLVLATFTAYPDRLPGSRSHRQTAKLFTRALARMEEPSRLYWVFAGNEKFSIPFYMQRVVEYADETDLYKGDRIPGGENTPSRALFITRARLLPWYREWADPPVVHAKDRTYALIEWPRSDRKSTVMPAPSLPPDSKTTVSREAPEPAFHAAPRSGLYAALLLLLAGSRP